MCVYVKIRSLLPFTCLQPPLSVNVSHSLAPPREIEMESTVLRECEGKKREGKRERDMLFFVIYPRGNNTELVNGSRSAAQQDEHE